MILGRSQTDRSLTAKWKLAIFSTWQKFDPGVCFTALNVSFCSTLSGHRNVMCVYMFPFFLNYIATQSQHDFFFTFGTTKLVNMWIDKSINQLLLKLFNNCEKWFGFREFVCNWKIEKQNFSIFKITCHEKLGWQSKLKSINILRFVSQTLISAFVAGIWLGFDLDLDLDLSWIRIWCGFDMDLMWIWVGFGFGFDLDLTWIWFGFDMDLDLIWIWVGFD